MQIIKFLPSARPIRATLLPALVLSVAACGDDEPTFPTIVDDIIDIVNVTSDVSTLQAAVQAAGLESTLRGQGPFTVFAPVDAAFDELGADAFLELLEPDNAELLSRILTFHVVPGAAVFSGDLTDGQMVSTLEGEKLTIGVSGGSVTVNGASVISADIEATNGVIHLIDAVLLPELDIVETAIVTSQTRTLVDALVAADLISLLQGLGPFTVFAPVNDAFAALGDYTLEALLQPANWPLLQKFLTYHVVYGEVRAADLTGGTVTTVEGSDLTIDVSSSGPTVNGASVIASDIVAGNGILHLVDEVLVPELDIVETATITDGTGTLAAAIAAGGLVSTLGDGGPFTVFAPVDAAFEDLGADQLEILLDPANRALLQKILTYHVVAGEVRAADLAGGTLTTVEGSDLDIDVSGAAPLVNGASVIASDIVVGNGVIHLIDGVLTENADLVDVATLNGFSTLLSLASEAGLVETLRSPNGGTGFTVFAPTNEAFTALASVPAGQALVDVLTYHVVSGTVESSALTDAMAVTSVEGTTFTVNIVGEDVTITDASGSTVNVVLTDVPAANGVVHVIDGVILPN